MKKWNFILLSLSLFTLGALTGKEMFPTTRRELVIQVLDEEYPTGYQPVQMTDQTVKGERLIDELLLLILNARKVEGVEVSEDEPTYTLVLQSKRISGDLLAHDLWLTPSGEGLLCSYNQESYSLKSGWLLSSEEMAKFLHIVEEMEVA